MANQPKPSVFRVPAFRGLAPALALSFAFGAGLSPFSVPMPDALAGLGTQAHARPAAAGHGAWRGQASRVARGQAEQRADVTAETRAEAKKSEGQTATSKKQAMSNPMVDAPDRIDSRRFVGPPQAARGGVRHRVAVAGTVAMNKTVKQAKARVAQANALAAAEAKPTQN